MPQASPTPLFCSIDQIGLECVAFNIPADRQKMFIILDGKGFKSALIKMTGSGISAMSVPALRVCQREPADKSRQLSIFVRFDDEVPVIAQHAKRQTPIDPSRSVRPPETNSVQTPRNRLRLQKSATAHSHDSARDKPTHLPTLASLCPSNKPTKPTPPCQ